MKIVYVPITIPWNLRSFYAMLFTFLATVTFVLCTFNSNWYSATFATNIPEPGEPDNVEIQIGLFSRGISSCMTSEYTKERLCEDWHVNLYDCRKNYGIVQWIEPPWCADHKISLVAFWIAIAGCAVGLINIVVSLVRERLHGFGGFVSFGCAVAAILLLHFRIIPSVAEAGKFSHPDTVFVMARTREGWGFTLVPAVCATVLFFFSCVLSLSLFCCAKYNENTPGHAPAPIYVVDAASAQHVTHDGNVEIAPEPGYEAVSGGAEDVPQLETFTNVTTQPSRMDPLYSSVDVEMRSVPPSSHAV